MSHGISHETNTELLFIVGDLGNGGQERQLYYLCKQLQTMGYRVSVIAWRLNKEDKYYELLRNEQIPIIDFRGMSFLKRILFTRRFIRENKVKVFHSFSFHTNPITAISTWGLDCLAVGGIRNQLNHYKKDMPFFLFLISCFTPRLQVSNNSFFAKDFLFTRIHRLFNRVTIINNALKIEDYVTHEPSENPGSILTVSIGRLYPEKRIDLLIELIERLVKRGFPIKHQHAGEGALWEDLSRQVQQLDHAGHFTLTGNQDDINSFIGNADLFIHSSEFEGYPNVIMEAMACGKAIVTTNCGDVALLVEDGVNGYVVEIDNVDQLEEKVAYLLNNPLKRKEMGRESRKKAERTFSIDKYVSNTITLYKTNK